MTRERNMDEIVENPSTGERYRLGDLLPSDERVEANKRISHAAGIKDKTMQKRHPAWTIKETIARIDEKLIFGAAMNAEGTRRVAMNIERIICLVDAYDAEERVRDKNDDGGDMAGNRDGLLLKAAELGREALKRAKVEGVRSGKLLNRLDRAIGTAINLAGAE